MTLPRHLSRTWTEAKLRQAMRLYAVTDARWLAGRSLASAVAHALTGGATMIQLRDKELSTLDLARCARQLVPICEVANVPLVIDDDIQAVKMSGADGVHVGQSDATCAEARQELGPDAIVGVSVQTVEQALAAQDAGASYLGVGAMFATPTKDDADPVSIQTLSDICRAVTVPVVAIGGIGIANVCQLADTGVDGVAVVSAIFASKDVEGATRDLSQALDACLPKERAR